MSQFYGTLSGQSRTTATRRGSAKSGVTTQAASYAGAIEVHAFELDGKEHFRVSMIPWQGAGDRETLCSGLLGDRSSVIHDAQVQGLRADLEQAVNALEELEKKYQHHVHGKNSDRPTPYSELVAGIREKLSVK